MRLWKFESNCLFFCSDHCYQMCFSSRITLKGTNALNQFEKLQRSGQQFLRSLTRRHRLVALNMGMNRVEDALECQQCAVSLLCYPTCDRVCKQGRFTCPTLMMAAACGDTRRELRRPAPRCRHAHGVIIATIEIMLSSQINLQHPAQIRKTTR